MIKILACFIAFILSVEYLINIKIELWQTSFLSNVLCFVSGMSFGHFISYRFLQREIKQTIE